LDKTFASVCIHDTNAHTKLQMRGPSTESARSVDDVCVRTLTILSAIAAAAAATRY